MSTNEEIVSQALAILKRKVRRKAVLTNSQTVKDYLTVRYSEYEHEVFTVLFLDTRHRLIEFSEMFRGTIDGASVHPREVVKDALRYNAAAVIFSHCHPSGVCEPSRADEALTQRLKEALTIVDVRVLDHIVCAGGEAYSFADNGLL